MAKQPKTQTQKPQEFLKKITRNIVMKILVLFLNVLFFASCNDRHYEVINAKQLKKMVVTDILINTNEVVAFKARKSTSDTTQNLIIQPDKSDNDRYYFFKGDYDIANDSTVIAYAAAFLYDEDHGFKKNGLWVYTEFYNNGNALAKSTEMHFAVDSVPPNWKGKLPKKEGIYFYKDNFLQRFSNEQSEEKFREKQQNGFYFIPNSGRLFNKIKISDFK